MEPRLSIIVAAAENGVIGRAGGLPWRLPADLKRFRELTLGHHIIMGRRTYESIGRLLPGRTMVVLSRRPQFAAPGALVARDLEEAVALARADGEVFVIGGAEVYRAALPLAGRIYRTVVHAAPEGDTFFPELAAGDWRIVEEARHAPDEKNPLAYSFRLLERVRAEAANTERSTDVR
jgi:dihydrofolate reductase